MTGRCRAALLGLALVMVAGASARADTRYAVVIGMNRGAPDEVLLRFAERDAERVAETLVALGDVAPENLLLLLAPSRATLARALDAFARRVSHDDRATLIVYYSGHADHDALHLGHERFGFSELKAAARAMQASLTLMLVDACRSGGLLVAKGARRQLPFVVEAQDAVRAEGLAIITSAAADEDALESDHLGGGVFTHHLLAGLAGAADVTADGRVSLAEAYRYTYTRTLATTSAATTLQHPSFAFAVEGQDDIILTDLGARVGRGQLRFTSPGDYVVVERFGAGEVTELGAHADATLTLVPGPYLVRRREPSALYEVEVHVRAGEVRPVDAEAMARVPFRHAVRRGYLLAERRALGVDLDGELSDALLPDSGPVVYGAIGLQLDLADVSLAARFRYGQSRFDNGQVAAKNHLVGVDVALYHLFDLGRHGVGFGLRVGIDWLAQRFDTTRAAPDNDQVLGRAGPFGRVELALGGLFTLHVDGGFEVYALELAEAGRDVLRARFLPTLSLGVSFAID